MNECCAYRNRVTFDFCYKKNCVGSIFCKNHINKSKYIYELFRVVFTDKMQIECHDMYMLFKYIKDYVNFENDEDDDNNRQKFFVELLKNIPKYILVNIYQKYWRMPIYLKRIYEINENTYRIENECNKSSLIYIQKRIRDIIIRKSIIKCDMDKCINKEDPFTYENLEDINSEKLFTFYDIKGNMYAFDIVELDYFIRKCVEEGVKPYNPYTRDLLDQHIINNIRRYMKYKNIKPKDKNKWETHLQAYTDLSIEIEKQGFYNSPDWFAKMSNETLIKVIKMFKNFSLEVSANSEYFKEYMKDDIIFYFCSEGIRMFSECNEDLYILCCNFMKALAMYSKDFYNNLPEWLIGINTSSRLSSIYSILNMDNDDISILSRYRYNINRNIDNFLLYYYVEYMQ